MRIWRTAILGGLLLSASFAWAGTINLPLTDDAFIKGNDPDTNLGDRVNLYVHNYGPKYTLVRFDAASIAGLDVADATLVLWLKSNYRGGEMSVHAITSSWNEATITWNNKPPAEAEATAVAEIYDNYGFRTRFIEIDVTTAVQRWADGSLADAGFLIVTSDAIKAGFESKERPDGTPAVLIVSTGEGAPIVTRVSVLDGSIILGDPPRRTFWEAEVDIDSNVLRAAKSVHVGLYTIHNALGRMVINGEVVQLPYVELTNQYGRWRPELGQTLVSVPLGYFNAGKNTIRFESGIGNWTSENIYDDYEFGNVEIIFSLR